MEIDRDMFQKAVILYHKVPLRIGAIDIANSVVLSDEEVLLKMVKTGRKFCRLIKMEGKWLADDIYWFPEKAMTVDEMKELIDKKYGPPQPIRLVMPGLDEDLSDDDESIFPKDMDLEDNDDKKTDLSDSSNLSKSSEQPKSEQQLQTQQSQDPQQN
jgi:hypothetical protein